MSLLNEGSDLATIVVGVGYLDACLASLLAKRFRQSSTAEKLLDSRGGALGSFSARYQAAYAMALIDKPILEDLMVFAELRNIVAHHHLELTFSDSEVAAQCERLKTAAALFAKMPGEKAPENGETLLDHMEKNPRSRFTVTTVLIAQRLLVDALGTKPLG